ncbi:sugar transferase [Pacificimonas pallii]|nr:sugar transferase [Pacificimonas pallii]
MLTLPTRPVLRPFGLFQSPGAQVLGGILVAVLLPWLVAGLIKPGAMLSDNETMTAMGCAAALMIGIYIFRRFDLFPGVRRFAYVIPSFMTSYAIVFAVFFFLRLDYTRLMFVLSFMGSISLFVMVCRYSRASTSQRFYIVPFGNIQWLRERGDLDKLFLQEPYFPGEPNAILVADLRADHGEMWERFIAKVAIAGFPVYHTKQLRESLEGRVEIEHLSENSFGSLLPNLNYRNIKRGCDLLAAACLLPLVAISFVIVGPLIKMSSPGPILFRQNRVGFRGRQFSVLKYRTMTWQPEPNSDDDRIEAAKTKTNDVRVTKLGKVLRRTRIDEIPQILNVLMGQMSFIGPRPEAVPLAEYYEERLSHYNYRHIVRPGISGWAQINQGHVAELNEVQEKLHYDFYYIKHFSAWLDMVIALRTLATMATGFGSK